MDEFLADQDRFAAYVGKLPEAIGLNFRIFRRDLEHKIGALERKMDRKFEEQDAKTDAVAADVAAILDILGRRYGPKA